MNLSQDTTSLASTALPSFPINSAPNSDASVGDKQTTSLSHLEPAIAATVSEMASSYQQEDPQRQTTISNLGMRQTQEQGLIVDSGTDDLPTTSRVQGGGVEDRLKGYPWYVGKKSRIEVEQALDRRQDGVFLIYESDVHPGEYAIAIK